MRFLFAAPADLLHDSVIACTTDPVAIRQALRNPSISTTLVTHSLARQLFMHSVRLHGQFKGRELRSNQLGPAGPYSSVCLVHASLATMAPA